MTRRLPRFFGWSEGLCQRQGPKRRRKRWRKADVVRNQFFSYDVYILNFVFGYDYRAMEIEFKTEIDVAEARLQQSANAAFALAGLGCLTLVWLLAKDFGFGAFLGGGCGVWIYHCFKKYRTIRMLTRMPDRLWFGEKDLTYCTKGKPALQIPYSCIRAIEYREGLALHLKKPLPGKLTVLDPAFVLSNFLHESSKQQADLFFKWFNPLVKARLDDIVHPNQAHHLAALQDR